MEIAKKIQTILLPKSPKVEGYELSAEMITAAEVGGDYYDIINGTSEDWVTIGDASGHGVIAGLIIMMVQVSIRSMLVENPNIAPSELIEKIEKGSKLDDKIKQVLVNDILDDLLQSPEY